ncbi:hypothetical protein L1049_002152 [Liquidambar formosana]|uniref:Uncharacterized protein n=1 Tax=Liquidambar formosana TaxID=63359 RepID=A0AAP0NF50_LIQFO
MQALWEKEKWEEQAHVFAEYVDLPIFKPMILTPRAEREGGGGGKGKEKEKRCPGESPSSHPILQLRDEQRMKIVDVRWGQELLNMLGVIKDDRMCSGALKALVALSLSQSVLPFGSGRRGCPKASPALHDVQSSLAAMIQYFEWKVSDAVDMEEGHGITLR